MQRGLNQALDEYLVLSAQAGDRDALSRLAARWTPKLLAFAARTLGNAEAAKDVVQETWEGALRTLRSLDDPARFPAWIYSIAARRCTDALRSKYRGKRLADAVAHETEARDVEIDADAETGARIDLAQALARLPSEQRIAVSLFFGDDMSVAEIAAVTGVPLGTVKSRLFAARQTLRAHMQGEEQ